jgi:hypothetical protein
MSTRDVEEKFTQAWNRAGMLPALQQTKFRSRLLQLKREARKPRVSGAGDEWEWDLALANKVDGIWTEVTAQSGKVYDAVKSEAQLAVDSAAMGAAKLGIGLWPIALAAVAVLYFYSGAKK